MELTEYFEPLEVDLQFDDGLKRNRIGEEILGYFEGGDFPDPTLCDIALLGVTEDRNALFNQGSSGGPDIIRENSISCMKEISNPG